MAFMDRNYDPVAGYQFNLNTALLHETRSSAWYAVGLLARNEKDDAEHAAKILTNIIGGQYHNTSEQWYGDYEVYPEGPYPGTEAYLAVIYNSWDPNWRGFVGTAFIIIVEEFGHLLPHKLEERLIQSIHLSALGDTYRVGGVDDDNLYPAYSNAAMMKAAVAGWVGRQVNDKNLTAEGETWGGEIIDLFNLNQTLSEFNGPTYLGVSLLALTLWAKYLPSDSVLGANGARMIREIWDLTGQLYNANMKNIAGPWDRSYSYDMQRALAIAGLWIWSFVGLDDAPMYRMPSAMAHVDDFEIGPLIAVLAPYHRQFVSNETIKSLTTFGEEHIIHRQAFSPPYDTYPRNITTWLSPNLTIGAESFAENVVGGPSINPAQFNPAVVQWLRKDGSAGFITLYPEVEALQAMVTPGRLNLTYPRGNASSAFTLHVSPNVLGGKRDVGGWGDVEGVDVKVSGNVDLTPTVAFCGVVGGACDPVNDFDLWNFTYSMPPGSTKVPNLVLDIEWKDE
ncbi:hypothetical protein PRZ48_001884 [Zasmidium cellare]|uniref:Uncharacterized protein n=1 Tax=Zasmidium cellare TaxID=395010 RepID=A0ABR0F4B0_ZASCE|nr:hypothetical protein PRZ48_001884 [Zasmidium cellare]